MGPRRVVLQPLELLVLERGVGADTFEAAGDRSGELSSDPLKATLASWSTQHWVAAGVCAVLTALVALHCIPQVLPLWVSRGSTIKANQIGHRQDGYPAVTGTYQESQTELLRQRRLARFQPQD